ncbi:UDP-N-acetylmuramyl pentapeptide phosphotransferase/UDP-N-acetylglucosamine-1-phosphate transferase [Desulfofundulus australicus DSM 11792]|uniref:UDP-N-acetylmuramyl pentapeptide phosphotransferase/UDP-N-acetylglucosamine-1-phosphate transferase n=1 Tax=Desulfofundulus australicus DSM 11792 TaxID=1121425 RepID=A0A1M5AGD6_9FIRM|nr:hypothetical protein [Desulfofundulus australicus]SHF28952.1 UDP-N-acetylmuramyl pentapeptide phosphotransferase/UDP-N-acetylglucosamine-1-phosphate transferase [Desulfofundulus australicus DSM 11792]
MPLQITAFSFPAALVITIFLGAMFTRLFLPGLMGMIVEAGFVRPNFRGEVIPLGVGLVFSLATVACIVILYPFLPGQLQFSALAFSLALAAFTCLGLVDDVWGSRRDSGLKGHLRNLLQGRLTTGALKALAGGGVSLFLATATGPLAWVPVNALTLALSVNTINLLDLRPGRAGKGFLLGSILLFAAGWGQWSLAFLGALAGSVMAYLTVDLKARAMMGDTGANALGAALGLTAIWVLPDGVKLVYLGLLIVLHVVAEKYSLTALIARSPLLDRLDRWGSDRE